MALKTWNIKVDTDGEVISTEELPVPVPVARTIQVTETTLAKAIKVAQSIWSGRVPQ